MRPPANICRPCVASSSRFVTPVYIRGIATQAPVRPVPVPSIFTPPFLTPTQPAQPRGAVPQNDKGKGRDSGPQRPRSNEEEVDDREWELRVGRAMMHLRDTLPVFFGPEYNSSTMFPPDVFSHNVVLKLPQPLPIKISSLTAYSMAFSIARNGMLALHSDMHNSLDRMTLSPTPPSTPPIAGKALTLSRTSIANRQKQIRIQISVHGTPRLPPHTESTWQTSSLYTISPYSGLIMTHEVESIRPLPGEGVAEWMRSRLLGWVKHEDTGPVACPRAVPVSDELEVVRYLKERQSKPATRALLIDLNGTLHVGSTPTPGAVRAIERLRAARVPFVFCSNSTKESTQHLVGRLRSMGFKVDEREVITSLGACRMLVEDRGLRRVIPYLVMSPSAKEEFSGLDSVQDTQSGHDSVILGLHEPSLSYTELNKAFRILKREPIVSHSPSPAQPQPSAGTTEPSATTAQSESESPGPGTRKQPVLIAPHAAMFQQSPATDDLPAGLSLGIGPFARALEQAAETPAEIVGKPTKRFFQLAIERMHELYPQSGTLETRQIAVVGDDIVNDLGSGTMELGLKRILVQTGKYRADSHKAPGVEDADELWSSFSVMVDDLAYE